MQQARRNGITITEVLVVLTIALIAVGIAAILRPRSVRTNGAAKDATQVRCIHQSWITYSREFGGVLPTPGLVARLPVDGSIVPGRGDEDESQNTTANLFSLCIIGNYFTPSICIGPTEPSPRVKEVEQSSYNFTAYQPAAGTYWDHNFQADLHKLSNVSYAHRPISGEFKAKLWRDTMDATQVIVGNRGPLGGVPDPQSITNKIHPPYDRWSGNLVWSDNHVMFAQAFPNMARPNDLGYIIAPECLPKGGAAPATDALITFTKEMTGKGPVVQHD